MKKHDQSKLAVELANHGIRLTWQRKVILDVIESASTHLHASDILHLAKERDKRIDRATVYRTLALLKEHGLVDELDLLHLDGTEHHYEVREGSGHIHIGCRRCGKIIEFETDFVEIIERQIRESTGCEVESMRIEVSALCPDCRAAR